MEPARRLASGKRPPRTIRCSACGAERTTYARGGIIVRCPGCGAYYQVPSTTTKVAGAADSSGHPPAAVPAAPATAQPPPENHIPPPAEPRDPDPPAPVAGGVRVVRAEEVVIRPAPPTAPADTNPDDAGDAVPAGDLEPATTDVVAPAAGQARRVYPRSDPRAARRSR